MTTTLAERHLVRANAIRLERAELCHDVRHGTLPFPEVLDHRAVQTMKVYDLLLNLPAQRRIMFGPRRDAARGRGRSTHLAQRMITRAGIHANTRVDRLTDRQREELELDVELHYQRLRGEHEAQRATAA